MKLNVVNTTRMLGYKIESKNLRTPMLINWNIINGRLHVCRKFFMLDITL